jgi:hypothetical protein
LQGLWFFIALYVCLFLFTIVAGLLLAEGTRRGVRWSAVCQALQIPVIVSSVLTCRLWLGVHVTVGYFGTQWVVETGIGSASLVSIGRFISVSPLMTAPGWGINLVALIAFLYLLWHLYKPSASDAPHVPSETPSTPVAQTPGEDHGG